ncbi:MAG: hypothetical protein AAFQ80_07760 [Cyanobacteria bacterium J06621_8]
MKLIKFLMLSGLALLWAIMFPLYTVANVPTSVQGLLDQNNSPAGTVKVPDFDSITFGSLGRIGASGSIPADYDQDSNYPLSRQWDKGDPVASVLKLGDIDDAFGVGNLSLNEVITKSGGLPQDVSLSSFSFIEKQSISSFVRANPALWEQAIKDVPSLAEVITQIGGQGLLESPTSVLLDGIESELGQQLSDSVSSIVPELNLDAIEMGIIDLSKYTLGDVKGLGESLIEDYELWENELIGDVAGLEDIPFSKFPKFANLASTLLSSISRVDMVWGDASGGVTRSNSVSGSNVAGYNVACDSACAHLELDDLENSGRDIRWATEGDRWALGNDPKSGNICPDSPWGVRGGIGLLGKLNCGREPTGRNPFGSSFKVALWEVDEPAETASTAIFFRICKRGFPDLGCTPYFIGPVPFLSVNRGDYIILGSDI